MHGAAPISVELLIELVRNQEHLYDSTSPQYNDHTLRDNSWNAIAFTLNSTPNEVKKKWKNLRDIFSRVYAKWRKQPLDGRRHDAKWVHFSALMFLADTLRPRRNSIQRGKRLPPERFEDIDTIETKPDVSQLELPVFCDSPQPAVDVQGSELHESEDLRSSTNQESYPEEIEAKKPRFEEDSFDLEGQRELSAMNDVNEAFGRLVTASLRDLPREKQALLRFKISEVLFNFGES